MVVLVRVAAAGRKFDIPLLPSPGGYHFRTGDAKMVSALLPLEGVCQPLSALSQISLSAPFQRQPGAKV